MSRAATLVFTRVLLVIFTFVLIVGLAQIALVAARLRAWGEVVLQSVLEMAATA